MVDLNMCGGYFMSKKTVAKFGRGDSLFIERCLKEEYINKITGEESIEG